MRPRQRAVPSTPAILSPPNDFLPQISREPSHLLEADGHGALDGTRLDSLLGEPESTGSRAAVVVDLSVEMGFISCSARTRGLAGTHVDDGNLGQSKTVERTLSAGRVLHTTQLSLVRSWTRTVTGILGLTP